MMRTTACFVAFLFCSVLAVAQGNGYSIEVKLKNSPRKELYLAYYFGDKTYVKDTAQVVNNIAVFSKKESLDYGVYMIVEPEKNITAQILIDDKDQQFFLELDYTNSFSLVDVQGSAVNQQFKSYLEYFNARRKDKEELDKKKEQEKTAEGKKKIDADLDKLDKTVEQYQQKFIKEHPGSLLAAMIKASKPLKIPDFTGTKEEKEMKGYRWNKVHWFDNINMADPRMLRSNFLAQKIDYYIDKLTVQQPDSLIKSVDEVLGKVKPSKENFQYFLADLLNKYAASKIIGQDAVYVHIALEYYDKLKPEWVDKEQLNKIVENASRLKPLLIGKKAPDMKLKSLSGTDISLHEFSAKYTVLFFYSTTCSNCEQTLPDLVKVADKFAPKGVKVFTVCNNFRAKDQLAAFINKNNMGNFFNALDDAPASRINTLYDIRSVPMIYILDEQKIIVSKRIGTDQVELVLNNLGL